VILGGLIVGTLRETRGTRSTAVGKYSYICTIHAGMKGPVTVVH
jgi:plastocyanin